MSILLTAKKKPGVYEDGDWIYCENVQDGICDTEVRQIANPKIVQSTQRGGRPAPTVTKLFWCSVRKDGTVKYGATDEGDSAWSLSKCRHATRKEIADIRKKMKELNYTEYKPKKK